MKADLGSVRPLGKDNYSKPACTNEMDGGLALPADELSQDKGGGRLLGLPISATC